MINIITFSRNDYQDKELDIVFTLQAFNRNLHVFSSSTKFPHVDHLKSFVYIRTLALLPEAVRLSQILSFCSSISFFDFKTFTIQCL